MSGRAAEMQIQTGQTGGLRVVRTQSPEGDDGQDAGLICLFASVSARLSLVGAVAKWFDGESVERLISVFALQ